MNHLLQCATCVLFGFIHIAFGAHLGDIVDHEKKYQKCSARFCVEPKGDQAMVATRWIGVNTKTNQDIGVSFQGTKEKLYGDQVKKLVEIPWLSDEQLARVEEVEEIKFELSTLTRTDMISEGDGDYVRYRSKSFEFFEAVIPFSSCSSTDGNTVTSMDIGLRTSWYKDEIWGYVVDKNGIHSLNIDTGSKTRICDTSTHENVLSQCGTKGTEFNAYGHCCRDGVRLNCGKNCRADQNNCGGAVDAATRRCPLVNEYTGKRRENFFSTDTITLKFTEYVMTPYDAMFRISRNNDQLFGEEGDSPGYFYVLLYGNDVNGADMDFQFDMISYAGDVQLTPRQPVPYGMMNSNNQFVTSKISGNVDVYYEVNSTDIECHEDGQQNPLCDKDKTALVHLKDKCEIVYTEKAKSPLTIPGLYDFKDDCKKIAPGNICGSTKAPTRRPTKSPTTKEVCMRHAIYRPKGRVKGLVGKVVGPIVNTEYSGPGEDCMCTPGYGRDYSLGQDGFGFACVKERNRGDVYNFQDYEENCMNLQEFDFQVPVESIWYKITINSVEVEKADEITGDTRVATVDVQASDKKEGSTGEKFSVDLKIATEAGYKYYVKSIQKGFAKGKFYWTKNDFKKLTTSLLCIYKTPKWMNDNEVSVPEFVDYSRCPENKYSDGSFLSCEELASVVSKGGDLAEHLAEGPSETRSKTEFWKLDKAVRVCSRTHGLIPKKNYNNALYSPDDYHYCPPSLKATFTMYEAEALCEMQGARLCTAWELKEGYAGSGNFGGGCDYNWMRVWSVSKCEDGAGTNQKYISRAGGDWWALRSQQRKNQRPKCQSRQVGNRVRCCASVSQRVYPPCSDCPAGATSDRGSHLADSCTCKNGYDSDIGECIPDSRREL